jgi:hypothetical protein
LGDWLELAGNEKNEYERVRWTIKKDNESSGRSLM